MFSSMFLGVSLIGAEWVLILLLLVSLLSVTLIVERWLFYRNATKGLEAFRAKVQHQIADKKVTAALELAEGRLSTKTTRPPDLETGMAVALLRRLHVEKHPDKIGVLTELVLTELAQYEVVRAKVQWERNLALLATIGANAPFVGLFGTVLGIIKAFHDLAQQAASAGAQTVSAGISEALIATAVGILVAIPAVVAFNLFQRRVRKATSDAEALKCFLLGQLAGER